DCTPPRGKVDGSVEFVQHRFDDVVLDLHAVGRHVVAADAIKIAPTNGVDGEAKAASDGFDDGLDRKHRLWPAVAAKCGVRYRIRFAGKPAQAHVRQVIAIVGMAQRAGKHGGRVIGDVAAVRSENEVEGEDMPAIVEPDLVTDEERVAL